MSDFDQNLHEGRVDYVLSYLKISSNSDTGMSRNLGNVEILIAKEEDKIHKRYCAIHDFSYGIFQNLKFVPLYENK